MDFHLPTNILKAFTKLFGVWDHHVNVSAVVAAVAAVAPDLVIVAMVLGLVNDLSIVPISVKAISGPSGVFASLQSICVLAHTVLALFIKALKTLYFAERLWWLSQWRLWAVWVIFLETGALMCCQVLGKLRCPRRRWIHHCWNICDELYMWFSVINVLQELLVLFCLLVTKVSSIHLSQSLDGLEAVLMALDSNSSKNRLATMGLIGKPMALPWTC